MLEDLAVLTGGTVISEDRAMSLAKVSLSDLGQAERITISKDETTILAGEERRQAIANRIAAIKRELEATDSSYDRDKLSERIAKLAGGVAVIKVGAPTETELRNRKLRIEDALNATRAAVEEGIIPGGGTVLLDLADDLESLIPTLQGDQITGVRLIQSALKEPLRQIATNAGANGDVVLAEIRRQGKGFNALTGTYEDLLSAGILDPAKVVRLALQDSVSIASLILTTEAIIADRPEPPSPPSGGDGMGGMGGMGMGGMGMGGMGMPGMGMM
jgi:chaperonin GroEL